jgi:hypothetical protein
MNYCQQYLHLKGAGVATDSLVHTHDVSVIKSIILYIILIVTYYCSISCNLFNQFTRKCKNVFVDHGTILYVPINVRGRVVKVIDFNPLAPHFCASVGPNPDWDLWLLYVYLNSRKQIFAERSILGVYTNIRAILNSRRWLLKIINSRKSIRLKNK